MFYFQAMYFLSSEPVYDSFHDNRFPKMLGGHSPDTQGAFPDARGDFASARGDDDPLIFSMQDPVQLDEYSFKSGHRSPPRLSDHYRLSHGGRNRSIPSVKAEEEKKTKHAAAFERMGLAAGGKLTQDIYTDCHPAYIWNTARTSLINVHILSPDTFEAITHICAHPTPITAKDYADAGLPFFVIEEDMENRLDGSDALNAVKSVSQVDAHVGVDTSGNASENTRLPKRCELCKKALCDCM